MCPSSLCGNWKAEVGQGLGGGFEGELLEENSVVTGEEMAWGRTFETNRGGKW